MFRRLIELSVSRPWLVAVLAAVVLGAAALRVPRMPVDVFPELNAPTVVVLTEAPGSAAEEVEATVTLPLESALSGLSGVRRVRSASAFSLSLVWVEFDWSVEIHRARQQVAERLASARTLLPPEARAEITPVTSITGEILLLALTSPDGAVDPLELRSYAEFELRNRLLAVPGVAQVSAIGGALPELQVAVEPERLALSGLAFADVVAAARSAHGAAGAGFLPDVGNRELPIRQSGRVARPEDVAGTVIPQEGAPPLPLGAVAEVGLGPAPRRGTASSMGVPAVVLTVQKAPGANTLALTTAIDRALDALQPTLPRGMRLDRHVFRQADFIDRSVANVKTVLRDAAIIVALVLAAFLLDLRSTLITLLALPLSLAIAVLALDALGMTLNVMTLGGLGVAIGALVDDAIIDVENVHRRLRENALRPAPERRETVGIVVEASNEIRGAMVHATVLICIVFLPLMALAGLEGRFFQPLAVTYVVSILGSLLVALTVTPAACRLLLARSSRGGAAHAAAGRREGALVRALKRLYAPALRFALRRRGVVLAAAAAATIAALLLARGFGASFLPSFQEGSLTVFLAMPPGTSLPESDRAAGAIERRILRVEGVRGVTRRTGRAERDEHAEPVSNSELDVTLQPGADKEAVRRAVAAIAGTVPGVTVQIGQPIEHRLSHVLSGTPAAIAVDVFGEDLGVLRRLAKDVERELKAVPGAVEVAADREVRTPSLSVRYLPAELAAAGLSPAAASEQLEAAFEGASVATVHDGPRRRDLVVRLAPSERRSPADVGAFVLRGAGGALVRVRDVAAIDEELASHVVARENGRRKAVISLNVAEGHDLDGVAEAVRARVEPLVHAAGCSLRIGGQFEAQRSAARTLAVYGGAALALMFVLLRAATGSMRAAALVLTNLPLAFIGGIGAVVLAADEGTWRAVRASVLGEPAGAPVLSIASLVGFVALFGIAARNGILLVNHYRHLREREACSPEEAITRGSLERLAPILMTALSAALGLLPIAIAGGEPGSELLAPLAVVVLGGLLTSTLLNLFVVPAGYSLLHRVRAGAAGSPRP